MSVYFSLKTITDTHSAGFFNIFDFVTDVFQYSQRFSGKFSETGLQRFALLLYSIKIIPETKSENFNQLVGVPIVNCAKQIKIKISVL